MAGARTFKFKHQWPHTVSWQVEPKGLGALGYLPLIATATLLPWAVTLRGTQPPGEETRQGPWTKKTFSLDISLLLNSTAVTFIVLPLGMTHRQMLVLIKQWHFPFKIFFLFLLLPESLEKSHRPVAYECFWSPRPLKNMFEHTLPIHVRDFSVYKLQTSTTEGLIFSSHIPTDFPAQPLWCMHPPWPPLPRVKCSSRRTTGNLSSSPCKKESQKRYNVPAQTSCSSCSLHTFIIILHL